MYTAKEVSTIKALYENLVFLNLIRIEELDGFGEPIAHYMPEAEKRLVAAITQCKGFSWKCHLDNASMETAEVIQKFTHSMPIAGAAAMVETYLTGYAMEELTESIFPKAELQFMLKNHHEYLDLVQDSARAGKLFADEMEDIGKPETGIQSLSDFAQTFGRVA